MLAVAVAALLILLALFGLSVWIANTSWLRITNVTVSGEDVIPDTSIRAAVTEEIAGTYVGIFSKANIFLYPKQEIEGELKTLYPTLMNAEVRAVDFHTLSVAVAERKPVALWCPSIAATPSQMATGTDSCTLLDADGLVYAHAPDYSGHVYERYSGALQNGPLPQQFLNPTQFHSLSALVDAFNKKIAPDTVTNITVDENNDVHLSVSSGYTILFVLKDDGGSVFEHFTLVLTAAPFTTHTLSDFEYIDLRFGNKVYYKLKS